MEATTNTAVRPFEFHASQADLDELQKRILSARWPEKETVNDDTQGVQLQTMQNLAQYWTTKYDWRKMEARLNSFPQFLTNIDGLDIHFIHVRSKEPDALPMILTHGWPGSIIELMKLIEPLTDPVSHGGKSSDAFHVIIPSMPGYGFSGKPDKAGWDTPRMATAYDELMRRLGYDKYVAQGGDWGAIIVDQMGVQAPSGLAGIHTNMACAVPPELDKGAFYGEPTPAGLEGEEKYAYERLSFFYANGLAYALEMGNRPQTLYGISDSPIALAAWILDHDDKSYQLITRVFEGKSEGLTPDDILDNITLYWLTNTGVSAARLYWENKLAFFSPKGVKVPTAVSVFPDEIYAAPKSWVEASYPNLIFYKKHPKGGHFAAWEQPGFITDDIRTAFASLR